MELTQAGQRYKPWSNQDMNMEDIEKRRLRDLPLYTGVSTIGQEEVPVHLVEFYERHNGRMQEQLVPPKERKDSWELAVELQRRKQTAIEKVRTAVGKEWKANSGIRLKLNTVRRIEEQLKGMIGEWGRTITNRSTDIRGRCTQSNTNSNQISTRGKNNNHDRKQHEPSECSNRNQREDGRDVQCGKSIWDKKSSNGTRRRRPSTDICDRKSTGKSRETNKKDSGRKSGKGSK